MQTVGTALTMKNPTTGAAVSVDSVDSVDAGLIRKQLRENEDDPTGYGRLRLIARNIILAVLAVVGAFRTHRQHARGL